MLSINAFLLRTQQLDSVAIQSNSAELTYSQLQQKVFFAAQTLKASGISEGENVALLGNNDLDYIVNVLAIWQLKAVPVLINPRLTEHEIEEQLATAECNFVLIDKKISLKKLNLSIKVISYPIKAKSKTAEENSEEGLNPEDTAVIIFTSGTSGKSKGVELSFNNLLQSAKVGDQVIKHKQDDKWLASLSFSHIGGFSIITRSLLFGVTIIIPEDLHTDSLTKAMTEFKPTLCSLVPIQLKRLLELGITPNEELRNILLGGGYIDGSLVINALTEGWNLTKVYGSTETASFVTALTGDDIYEKPKSVGKALKPNQIMIVNDTKFQIPWGEIGEIAVSSPATLKGYYKNVEETERKFEEDFYLTGDIGYLDADSYLFVEARRTDLIVTGGENVNPNEVENRINEHPLVKESAVFPLKDDDWGEIVAAAIVMKENNNLNLENLQEFLKDDLAGFKIPKKIFIEKSLPINEQGKTLRSVLVERYEGV